MDGNHKKITDELFSFGERIMKERYTAPFVAFLVKDDVIVSKSYNLTRETQDPTMQDCVAAIRRLQKNLETGDLSDYTLYTFFEPSLIGFDLALWADIRKFVWCAGKNSYPVEYNYYNLLTYGVEEYAKDHPGKIEILPLYREKEAKKIASFAVENKYFPISGCRELKFFM